ncbi:histidine--tRNA ligase [Bacillus horti]|uniref:Histidine--tRNA ligase n=1 Tax=Caldalkalibacillus horti TaxID=77523 RepID=A0ABT9VTC5_9BACI|nr:histidine--tRNA ligase [Bacillus horti]MDQ0164233.1 histidyl-tRNA synthetase [Bacillus horti]
MEFKLPRGTTDILPEEVAIWQYIEGEIKELCHRFNYLELRTPMFEHTELFRRGVGETTDVVEKEMYTFLDKGDRSLTLRPEGTAGLVRSYVENKMHGLPQQPVKLYYVGPMFRYERPQAGRNRQFTQFGVEAIGAKDASIDAEVIAMAMEFYKKLGLQGMRLEINSVGCPTCRPKHKEALIAHLKDRRDELPEEDRSRLERNPLRVLDSKHPVTQELTKGAPSILDYLCDDCGEHFEQLQSYLTAMSIPFHVNPRMVRGLDYYTQTAFEIIIEGFGAIGTVCGGGRYNGLVQQIGGENVPGIGFGLGIERVILALKTQKVDIPIKSSIDCYLVALGDEAKAKGVSLVQEWRLAGLSVDQDYLSRNMKPQLKSADRLQATFVAILGSNELEQEIVVLKRMDTGEQIELAYAEALDRMLKEIKKED